MNINNINQTTFGCVKIKEGGKQFLEQEGCTEIDNLKEEFKNYKWNLNIDGNGYSITSPTTMKTHTPPFSIKKQYENNQKKENSIIVRMGEKNRVRYKVSFKIKEEIQKIYSCYKKASPLEKMKILIKILEKNVKK